MPYDNKEKKKAHNRSYYEEVTKPKLAAAKAAATAAAQAKPTTKQSTDSKPAKAQELKLAHRREQNKLAQQRCRNKKKMAEEQVSVMR